MNIAHKFEQKFSCREPKNWHVEMEWKWSQSNLSLVGLCVVNESVVIWNRHDNPINIHTISELLFLIALRDYYFPSMCSMRKHQRMGMACRVSAFNSWHGLAPVVPFTRNYIYFIWVWLRVCGFGIPHIGRLLTVNSGSKQLQPWWIWNSVELVLWCHGTRWYTLRVKW